MANHEMAATEIWLAGGGETGEWLRSLLTHPAGHSHNLQTVLGTVETWSQSLKTALNILLNNRLPMFIVWGRDRILFYNDACLAVLRACNSWIPCGRSIHESWDHQWAQMRSDVEQVLSTGQPWQRAHLAFPVNPDAHTSRVHFDWSYSALLDERGRIRGVFATGVQVSARELGSVNASGGSAARSPTEIALQKTIKELNHHLETLPLATVGWDRHFRVDFWSQRAESLFGWTAEEVLGKTPFDWQFVLDEDREQVHQTVVQLLNGVSTPCQNRNYRKDGSLVFCEWYNSTLVNDQGHLVSVLSFILDVTDRKLAESTLKQQTEQLRLFIAASSDIVYRMSADWKEMRRLEGKDFLASTNRPSLNWIETYIPPEDQSQVRTAIQEAIRSKNFFELEHRVIRQDGTIGWTFSRALPLLNEQGEIVEWLGAASDISDRKAAEMTIQQREARYLAILEDQTELITRFQSDGRLLFVNDAVCRYYGVSRDEIIGQRYQPLIYPEDQPKIDRCLASLSPENPVSSVEHRVFVNGIVRWMHWTNRAIYDNQGNLLELQSVGRDIDDRKQAELRLKSALAEKEVLLQEVYHRVKNNLQLIQSMLHMQQRRLTNPDAIQSLQDSRSRIMTISLVHEILYQSDNLAQINLRHYIPTLVDHLTSSQHGTDLAVVFETVVESIIVPMKKAICCGLILNELVTNVLKYAFPENKSGRVLVTVTVDQARSGNIVTMTVQDNGIGFAEPIDQSNVPTLGLTLVQDFVDQLRGELTIESGQGCRFQITFNLES